MLQKAFNALKVLGEVKWAKLENGYELVGEDATQKLLNREFVHKYIKLYLPNTISDKFIFHLKYVFI
jgi:hypothetical protein